MNTPVEQQYFNAGYNTRRLYGKDSVNRCPTDIAEAYQSIWLDGFSAAQADEEERSLSSRQGW